MATEFLCASQLVVNTEKPQCSAVIYNGVWDVIRKEGKEEEGSDSSCQSDLPFAACHFREGASERGNPSRREPDGQCEQEGV